MKQKKRFYIHKGVLEWIVSYVVVLFIPALICSVFFIYSFFITWKETKGANSSALRLIADEIDDIFNRTLKMEYNIQNNGKLNAVSKLRDELSLEEYYLIVEARESCIQYDVLDEAIRSYYIFFPNMEMMFGRGKYNDLTENYELVSEEFGMTKEAVQELLFSKHSREFFVNQANGSLCYITSIPKNGVRFKMNIIMELDYNYIQNILKAMDHFGNSSILLMDDENQIVASRNMGTIDVSNIEEIAGGTSEYQPMKLNGKRMLVSCIESETTNLKYVSIIPYTDFWFKALQRLFWFIAALFCCIVLGIVAAWMFANTKYKTYGQLNDIIREKLGNKENGLSVNHQKEIASAIRNMVDEYEVMREKLTTEQSVRREAILTSIMEGRIRPEDILRVLQTNHLEVKLGKYVLMLFRVNSLQNLFEKETEQVSVKEIEGIGKLIVHIVGALGQKNIDSEIIYTNESIVAIINFGEKDAEECLAEIDWLETFTKAKFSELKIMATITLSDLHNQVCSLNNAYIEALRVWEYQHVENNNKNSVMNYQSMLKATETNYLFTLENEVQLVKYLNLGKEEEACLLVRNICEKNVLLARGSEEILDCLTWDLAACLLKFENNRKDKLEQSDAITWLEEIKKSISIYDRLSMIEQRIHEICKNVQARKENKDVIWAKEIKNYVLEHYQDPNLSNGAIAEYFKMNSAYMSTVFKSAEGTNLVDYIHQVRVDKAKELLKNTDMTVEQISVEVGCSGSAVLRRIFKKCEGISPIQYRDNNKA